MLESQLINVLEVPDYFTGAAAQWYWASAPGGGTRRRHRRQHQAEAPGGSTWLWHHSAAPCGGTGRRHWVAELGRGTWRRHLAVAPGGGNRRRHLAAAPSSCVRHWPRRVILHPDAGERCFSKTWRHHENENDQKAHGLFMSNNSVLSQTLYVPRMSALFLHRPPICERATDHTYTKGCSLSGKKCVGTK